MLTGRHGIATGRVQRQAVSTPCISGEDDDERKRAGDSQLSWKGAMRLSCFEAMTGHVLTGPWFSGETRKADFIKNLEYGRKESNLYNT